MQLTKALYLTVLCGSLSAPLLADITHDDARALRMSGQILPLSDILQQINPRYPGEILSAQLIQSKLGYRYKIELLTHKDEIRSLLLDAETGKILNKDLGEL